jgi:hypothetical protein
VVTANTEPTIETRLHTRILKHVKTTALARLRLNHSVYSLEGTKGYPQKPKRDYAGNTFQQEKLTNTRLSNCF